MEGNHFLSSFGLQACLRSIFTRGKTEILGDDSLRQSGKGFIEVFGAGI
jgi:hypothetical protein